MRVPILLCVTMCFGAGLTIAPMGGPEIAAMALPRGDVAPACHAREGKVMIPAGDVLLGEDGDASAGRREHVAAFRIDRHEVTNRQFARFVAATGYVTAAERDGAGAVFVQPAHIVDLNPAQWWRMVPGADWRHPQGPQSTIADAPDRPVVQVTWEDAQAYARWSGGALPTRSQWERAARAGQDGLRQPRQWAYAVDGTPTANTWQGPFPVRDTARDGHAGLADVGCFAPNAFGLYDMIGNVWEWTTEERPGNSRVVRGGSYLCADTYCANFRPAGFQAQEHDLPTSHIGFRTVATG